MNTEEQLSEQNEEAGDKDAHIKGREMGIKIVALLHDHARITGGELHTAKGLEHYQAALLSSLQVGIINDLTRDIPEPPDPDDAWLEAVGDASQRAYDITVAFNNFLTVLNEKSTTQRSDNQQVEKPIQPPTPNLLTNRENAPAPSPLPPSGKIG